MDEWINDRIVIVELMNYKKSEVNLFKMFFYMSKKISF